MLNEIATGGCLCGAVRYEAKPKQGTAYYCHCRDCQIGSASAFTVAVFTDVKDFQLKLGTLSAYSTIADSGRKLDRKFCPQCGTPLIWTGEGFPGVVLVSLSSLDDPRPINRCMKVGPIVPYPGAEYARMSKAFLAGLKGKVSALMI